MSDASTLPRHVPAVEIFIDGSNFNRACEGEGVAFRVDIHRFVNRLSRGYRLVRLRYYAAPLLNRGSVTFRRQQKFFDELCRNRRIGLVLGRYVKQGPGRPAVSRGRRRRT